MSGFDKDKDETHSSGKHNFHDTYNAPDAAAYMTRMIEVSYVIADHSSAVVRRAIEELFVEESDGIVLELAAGYGLSMSPVKTTMLCNDVFKHFHKKRQGLEKDLPNDRAFWMSATRNNLPKFEVVGQDIANHALEYGKNVGLFDYGINKNLELEGDEAVSSGNALTDDEKVLCRRTKLVVATGAFSYITSKTLNNIFACWKGYKRAQLPIFCFFPLVATDVSAIISSFALLDMDVYYYEPSKTWLPQRRFADQTEATAISAKEDAVLAQAGVTCRPAGELEGHLHATVLIIGSRSSEHLKVSSKKWVEGN